MLCTKSLWRKALIIKCHYICSSIPPCLTWNKRNGSQYQPQGILPLPSVGAKPAELLNSRSQPDPAKPRFPDAGTAQVVPVRCQLASAQRCQALCVDNPFWLSASPRQADWIL